MFSIVCAVAFTFAINIKLVRLLVLTFILRNMGTDIVHLIVGEQKKKYAVHENLLVAASTWFAKKQYSVLKSQVLHRENIYNFPNMTPFVCETFLALLYGSSFEDTGCNNLEGFLDIYVFACETQCLDLKNEAIDSIQGWWELDCPTPALVGQVFERTKNFENSKLLDLCVYFLHFAHSRKSHKWTTKRLEKCLSTYPGLLTKYLAIEELARPRKSSRSMTRYKAFNDRCHFHDHGLELSREQCAKRKY